MTAPERFLKYEFRDNLSLYFSEKSKRASDERGGKMRFLILGYFAKKQKGLTKNKKMLK